MSNPLKLTFPEPLDGQEFLIETEPAKLKKIINNEGFSDLVEEIKRFTKIIHGLNRCSTSLSHSETHLKILHNKYSNISNSVRDYTLETIRESKEVDRLMHQLTTEMSYAFKAFVVQLQENNKWVLGLTKKAAFAVNYAIHYLSVLKTELYILDKALPSYLWQEIYQLYQYAEDNKLLKAKIKDTSHNKIRLAPNITNTLSRAALMASMDPFNLSRKESWNTFYMLGNYVADVEITQDIEMVEKAYCFKFNTKESSRPMLIKDEPFFNKYSRYLIIDSFTKTVKQELNTFSSSGKLKYQFLSDNKLLHEKLLQLMYRYSVQYIARESDRYPIQVEAKAFWGYQDIYNLLSSSIPLDIYPRTESLLKQLNKFEPSYPLDWQTVNQSTGGACIQEQQFEQLSIADGTPLIISKDLPNNEGRWQFAISCWYQSKTGINQVGIKYIKGNLNFAKVGHSNPEEYICIGPGVAGCYFLLTPAKALDGAKNLVIELAENKFLAHTKSFHSCYGADLVQVEMIKKSV